MNNELNKKLIDFNDLSMRKIIKSILRIKYYCIERYELKKNDVNMRTILLRHLVEVPIVNDLNTRFKIYKYYTDDQLFDFVLSSFQNFLFPHPAIYDRDIEDYTEESFKMNEYNKIVKFAKDLDSL